MVLEKSLFVLFILNHIAYSGKLSSYNTFMTICSTTFLLQLEVV
jgi:hypothetical protein